MIKINALYFLLLIECVAVLAAATIMLALRGKKRHDLSCAVPAELQETTGQHGTVQTRPEQTPTEAQPQTTGTGGTGAAVSEELANSKYEVMVLEGQLKEKDKKLQDMQKKFEDMEKEYLVLYEQQQKSGSSNP